MISKSYLQSKDCQYTVPDCLVDFYAYLGLSIAFPELAIPAVDKLKEYLFKVKGTRSVKAIRALTEKMKTHKNYIEQKRALIQYTPNRLEEANAFLRTTGFERTPLGNFLTDKISRRVLLKEPDGKLSPVVSCSCGRGAISMASGNILCLSGLHTNHHVGEPATLRSCSTMAQVKQGTLRRYWINNCPFTRKRAYKIKKDPSCWNHVAHLYFAIQFIMCSNARIV